MSPSPEVAALKSPLAPPAATLPTAGRCGPSGGERARVARPGRRVAPGLAMLVAAVTLGGCMADNTPTSYNASGGIVRQNYLEACTGEVADGSSATLASETTCACAFDEVITQRVPYNAEDRTRVTGYPADAPTFQDLEPGLADDPGRYSELPADIREEIERCAQPGPRAPGATTSTTGTGTTAGTTG